MTRGRKPLPTHLKLLRGNPGCRPLNEAEPQPSGKKPKCPSHLNAEAKAEWRRITKLLDGIRMLHFEDGQAIAIYCEAWSRYLEATVALQKYGLVLSPGAGKLPQQSPYLAIANKASEQMRHFLSEFGLTPSSRSRVKSSKPAPRSGFDAFLNRKQG